MLRREMKRTIVLMLRKMRWIEDDERKMMVLKMMMWRRTKRIMLRMMMWRRRRRRRRRTDPKTGTHTLCEPAQSKCTSTLHKSHVVRKFTGK